MAYVSIKDLKKDSLEETYKSVNEAVCRAKRQDVQNVLTSEELNNFDVFETSLFMIMVDRLRFRDAVLKALLSSNPYMSYRALQCHWFFEDITGEELQHTVLPHVSLSVRCKIITQFSKLCKVSNEAAHLLWFARKVYGSKTAEMLLPACEHEEIEKYLLKYKPSFSHNTSSRVLIRICRRQPQLVENLLLYLLEDTNSSSIDKPAFVDYITTNHPQMFMKCFRTYYNKVPSVLLIKAVKRLAKVDKSFFIEHGWRMLRSPYPLLNMLSLSEKIEYLCNTLKGDGTEDLEETWVRLKKEVLDEREIQRSNIIQLRRAVEGAYHQVFGQELWHTKTEWSPELLTLLPTEERRQYVVLLTTDQQDVTSQLLYLLPCYEAFPALQQAVSQEADKAARLQLIEQMFRNAELHRDGDAFLSVLKYLILRHRNEGIELTRLVLQRAVATLHPRHYSEAHWTTLLELGAIHLVLCNNWQDFKPYLLLLEYHMEYLMEHNSPVDHHVETIVKYGILLWSYGYGFMKPSRHKYRVDIFKLYYAELVRSIKKNPELVKKKYIFVWVLKIVNQLNTRRLRIATGELEYLVEAIDEVVSETPLLRLLKERTYFVICKDPMLKKKYFTALFTRSQTNELSFFEELFHQGYLKPSIARRLFAFLGLGEKLKANAVDTFKAPDIDQKRVSALKLFSVLASVDDWLGLVREYLPGDSPTTDYSRPPDWVSLQLMVPTTLRYIIPAQTTFPAVFNFMKGDFLKPSLTSFFTACTNSPTRLVSSLLSRQVNQAVSVRKHLINMQLLVLPLEEQLTLVTELWPLQKHHSIRELLLHVLTRCFIELPSVETLEVVRKCVLDKDVLLPGLKLKLTQVAEEWVDAYLNIMYEYASEHSHRPTQLRHVFNELNENNTRGVSPATFNKLVSDLLFLEELPGLHVFTFHFMHHYPQHVDTILTLLRARKQNSTSLVSYLTSLNQFCMSHYLSYNILDKILVAWDDFFPHTAMDLFLKLSYYSLFFSIAQKDRKCVSQELGTKLSYLLSPREGLVSSNLTLLVSNTKDFLPMLHTTLSHFFAGLKRQKQPVSLPLTLSAFLDHSLSSIHSQQTTLAVLVVLLLEPYNQNNMINPDVKVLVSRLNSIEDNVVRSYLSTKRGLIQ